MFTAGKSGNPKGRPKNSKNSEFTARLKAFYVELFDENIEQLKADFIKLTPRDRFKVLLEVNPYFLPKLQGITMELDTDVSKLSDDQATSILKKIIEAQGGSENGVYEN